MSTAIRILEIGTAIAVSGIALLALADYLRTRDQGRLLISGATGAMGLVALLASLHTATQHRFTFLTEVTLLGLLACGLLLVEFRHTLIPTGPRAKLAVRAAVAFVAILGTLVRLPPSVAHPYTATQFVVLVAVLGVWTACIAEPAARFWTASKRKLPVERARLRFLTVAYAGILLIVLAAIGGRSVARPQLALGLQLVGVAVIPLLFAALTPPRSLRDRWLAKSIRTERERLLLTLPAIVWTTDAQMRITSSNGAGLLDLGTTSDEYVGYTLSEFYDKLGAGDTDFARTAIEMHRRVLEGDTVRYDNTLGDRVYANHMQPLYGSDGRVAGLAGLAVDITDRMRAEERLIEAQSLAHIGSWHWDVATERTTWSEELFRIFGLDPGDEAPSLDETLEHFVPEDRERLLAAVRRTLETKESFALDHRVVRPNGELRTVAARGRPVVDQFGEVTALVGTAQDITEQRAAEDALRDAYRREHEVASRLRGLDEMKNAFLTAVSHELRTPLTAVLGFAYTLQGLSTSGDGPQQGTELVDRLVGAAEKLERLLGDLLDLDRLSRGIVEPRRRPVDVGSLVRRVVTDLHLNIEDRITVDAPGLVAFLDPAKVERIVENLLANAAKYTPRGTPITVAVREVEGGVLLTVSDRGPGVPVDARDTIFEPFQQGDGRSAHAPGVGIGLALVARFAELHDGRAWVENRPEGGASFHVFLGTPSERPLEISTPNPVSADTDQGSVSA